MRLFVIKRKWLYMIVASFIVGFGGWYLLSSESIITTSKSVDTEEKKLEINMVTGEFKSKTADGKEIEAYRFDPGTILLEKNNDVTLSIVGVNGEEHPFYIEGTSIKGVVKKGQETVVNLNFKEEGTYRLICDTHSTSEHGIPMIAYIVVD
ncbi:cupredoxin domain-containing protein [Metabacillus herbersteinensis]|uniref:Cupredoxin domain-containing protein n=1 Tax=Metabacillus herbersteinensis TaxID=283816 RepID=A0ABV6GJM6_9BACI